MSITVRFTNVRYILQQQTHKINVTHQQIRPRQRILGDSEHRKSMASRQGTQMCRLRKYQKKHKWQTTHMKELLSTIERLSSRDGWIYI